MNTQNMSSRERYLTAIGHKEADRVPIFLDVSSLRFFTPDVYWYNQFERAEKLLELGCDPMINIWLPTPVPHPDVQIRVWREKSEDGNIYIGKEFDTPKGTIRQIVHETDDWCSSLHGFWVQRTLGNQLREEYGMHVFDDWNISRRTEPWVKGPEDLEKLRYILQKPARWQLDEWLHDAQRAMEFAKKHDLLTMVRRTIVSDASQWFCGIEWFMMQLFDDPEFVEEFLSIFQEIADWQAELALTVKPDVFQRRGWYDSPEFWGGRHFTNHILPSINREADLAHEAGTYHCYLLTEKWGPYMKDFKSLKSDILWGADPFADSISLEKIKEAVGMNKTILGGLSSEQHLDLGTPEYAREGTRNAIKTLAKGGGYILAVSSSLWPEAKWENVAAVIDEAHKSGNYPIKL